MSFDISVSKPNLRRELEADMKRSLCQCLLMLMFQQDRNWTREC